MYSEVDAPCKRKMSVLCLRSQDQNGSEVLNLNHHCCEAQIETARVKGLNSLQQHPDSMMVNGWRGNGQLN